MKCTILNCRKFYASVLWNIKISRRIYKRITNKIIMVAIKRIVMMKHTLASLCDRFFTHQHAVLFSILEAVSHTQNRR